jgi:hypothetical protein
MKKLCLLLLLLVLAGCAKVVVINEEGVPARNYDLQLTNPSTGISAVVYVHRVVEMSKDSVAPEYLNLFQKYTISKKNTKGVILVMRVKNPKGIPYQVQKNIQHRPSDAWEFSTIEEVVYKGKDFDKTWQISLPMDGAVKATVDIIDKAGNPMLTFGEFRYIIK